MHHHNLVLLITGLLHAITAALASLIGLPWWGVGLIVAVPVVVDTVRRHIRGETPF